MRRTRSFILAAKVFFVLAGILVFVLIRGESTEPDDGLPDNFHAIADGRAYRSNQPTPDELRTIIEKYGVRTVINLRGPNPDETWYRQEAEVCRQAGIEMVDHPMSSRHLPEPELLEQVVDSLETSAEPMLIHCEGGADRSGAVAAIYRMRILGEDRDAAQAELSPEYLHFREFKPCMDRLIEIYEPEPEWLDAYTEIFADLQCVADDTSSTQPH